MNYYQKPWCYCTRVDQFGYFVASHLYYNYNHESTIGTRSVYHHDHHLAEDSCYDAGH